MKRVNVTMRPVRDDDEPFLKKLREEQDRERLYLDYFPPEIEETVKQIITTQFAAHSHDRKNVNWDHQHLVIEVEEMSVGRLMLLQCAKEVRVADLEIEQAHRGLGLSHAILMSILNEANESRRVVRIHLSKSSNLGDYFVQQGFRVLEDQEMHYFMEWTPPSLQGNTVYFDTGKPAPAIS